MPLYDYKCSKCGNTIEVLQDFGDPAPQDPCEALVEHEDDHDRREPEPCGCTEFEGPLPCVQHQRWRGEDGNDGRGGWERQPGGFLIRKSKNYGRRREQEG